MLSFPNRCQHIKVNGTQCGCPALRRNRLCYFHKRHHEERISLNADRRRCNAAIYLPVLEDANSIQVSLMQVIRLLLTGQLDPKIAGLALYALQTASANLRRTNFDPFVNNVVLDPNTVSETPLEGYVWNDNDFITEEQKARARQAAAEEEARRQARIQAERRAISEAEANRLILEGRREAAAEAERERREQARLEALRRQKEEAEAARAPSVKETYGPAAAAAVTPAGTAVIQTPDPPRRPPVPSVEECRKQIADQVRKALPELTAVIKNAAMKKENNARGG
jgi:hypothetical protein